MRKQAWGGNITCLHSLWQRARDFQFKVSVPHSLCLSPAVITFLCHATLYLQEAARYELHHWRPLPSRCVNGVGRGEAGRKSEGERSMVGVWFFSWFPVGMMPFELTVSLWHSNCSGSTGLFKTRHVTCQLLEWRVQQQCQRNHGISVKM